MNAPLQIISSMAARHILADVIAAHTKATGDRVNLTAVGGVDAAARLREGAAFDIAILAADALANLASEGHVVADTIRVVAMSPTAIAVRSGFAKPGICDEPSLQALVQSAQTIGLSSGPSGIAVRTLLTRWGSAVPIVEAPPGTPVAHLIARGDADVGFQQLSELMGEAGITIVGPVPETLLPKTTFSAALCRVVSDPMLAFRVLNALTAPTADAIKRRHGMEPPAA